MDRRRLNKLNDNMDPIPIFALHKQMTIALNNLKLMTANKYQAHVFFFRFNSRSKSFQVPKSRINGPKSDRFSLQKLRTNLDRDQSLSVK